MLLNESIGYRVEGLPHNQNLFSTTRPNDLKFLKDVASYNRPGLELALSMVCNNNVLSPDWLKGVEHYNWHLQTGGSPQDDRDISEEREKNSILRRGTKTTADVSILDRVSKVVGKKHGAAVGTKYIRNGETATYRKKDLTYDIKAQYLVLEAPST